MNPRRGFELQIINAVFFKTKVNWLEDNPSIGRLEPLLADRVILYRYLHDRKIIHIDMDAIEELYRRVKAEDFHGYTLTLKLRFHDFRSITRSMTQEDVLYSIDAIRPVAQELLDSVDYSETPIRLLGLSVSNTHEEDPNLYEDDSQLRIRFPDFEDIPK